MEDAKELEIRVAPERATEWLEDWFVRKTFHVPCPDIMKYYPLLSSYNFNYFIFE